MTRAAAIASAKDDASTLLLLLGFGLLVLGPLVPNHYPPWGSFHAETVSILGFGVLAAAWLRPSGPREWPTAALLPLVFAAVPIFQAWTGKLFFWGDAWMASSFLSLFALAIVVGHGLVREHGLGRIVHLWAVFVVGSAMVSTGIALEQWLQLDRLGIYAADLRPGGRPYANLGQPNLLATWLMLGMVGLHVLYETRRLGLIGLLSGSLFLAFGMAMTQSRAGWLEMLFLAILLVVARSRANLRLSPRGVMATAVTFLGCVVAWPFLCELLLLSPGRDAAAQAAGGLRLLHWRSLIDSLIEQPWSGYGWTQVSVAQAVGALRHPATSEVIEHSHNLLLDLLIWNGVPLGLVAVVAIGGWVAFQIKQCHDPRCALLLGGIGAVLLHAMLEFPLEYAYFLLPVGLMVGMVGTFASPLPAMRVPRWISASCVAALAGLLTWVAVDYWRIEETSRAMRFQLARIGGAQAVVPAPDVSLLTQQREFWRFARTAPTRNLSEDDLDWMKRVATRYAYPPSLYRYALAAGMNRRPAEAASTLAHLCKVHSKEKCQEAKAAWIRMAEGDYPELGSVELPAARK